MIKQTKFRTGVLILMIVLAALSRLIPHPANVTPVGAMALFGGAYFSRKYLTFLVPVLAMWFSDLVLNNTLYAQYYDGFVWAGDIWVYASLIFIGLIGITLLKKVSVKHVVLASLLGSVLFFLVTNFGVWAGPYSVFPKNFSGLLSTYVAGLPFFRASLLGDLFYCGVLFGTFEWAKSNWSMLRRPVQA
ncbi:MAG: DUF6580 family putative transport protein [Saprospiraceae bacterium]|nr:hypothetical protein [Lewinella sp.]